MAADSDRFLNIVREFADNVLTYGHDVYGEPRTPLIVDAIHPSTRAGAKFDVGAPVAKDALLSNGASQHRLFRVLVALSELTGEPRYRDTAREVMAHWFQDHADSQGLIYWGGHVAWDLTKRAMVFGKGTDTPNHELKFHYPYYEWMWEVDPDATRRYIEAFWNAHVRDWSILNFNRHGGYEKPLGKLWDHEYAGGDVFFWNTGLTFVNTGSDLYYSAALLSKFSGDPRPLTWAKRLAYRYVQTRQEGVGISGYQFSQSTTAWCNGPEVRGDRAQYQYAPFLPPGHLVYEGTIFKPRPQVERCKLRLGEILGPDGEEFTRWAIEEMTAWGRVAYRREDNAFIPMLTDGYSLEGFVHQIDGYYGRKGDVERPMRATADFFRMYAYGYRVSGDDFLWEMARAIALGLGLGDIGEPGGAGAQLNHATDEDDVHALYGLLDLHRATGVPAYLNLASQVGENILRSRYVNGFFEHRWHPDIALVDDPAPLALLHLAAALAGSDVQVPVSVK